MTDDFRADLDAIRNIEAIPVILDVVCRVTGMRFAAVARVTGDRWVCLAVNDEINFGLTPGGELKIETTICNEIRQKREAVIIENVAEDAVYAAHPTPAMYGFQSYISVPVYLKNGSFFGTLCAIDPRPTRLKDPATVGMFTLFAELIALHLDAGQRLASSEANLVDERRTSELRDQFIAVLGHDLRNPLAAIAAGTFQLKKAPLDERSGKIVGLMEQSVKRMSALIDNVLDFARGRLGGGLHIAPSDEPLEPVLRQVLEELKTSHSDRVVDVQFSLRESVTCDPIRIGQLFSNLLANALTHGAPDKPVRVSAATDATTFELAVVNEGDEIPPQARDRLFRPFTRGDVESSQGGLGLGLYIAAEIARMHSGKITVDSTRTETRFTFRMPRRL